MTRLAHPGWVPSAGESLTKTITSAFERLSPLERQRLGACFVDTSPAGGSSGGELHVRRTEFGSKASPAEGTLPAIAWTKLAASALKQTLELSTAWDRLNARRGDLPFLSSDAMIAALEIFGEGNEKLLVGKRGPRVVAMFLLVPLPNFLWSTFQPSQIPLGAWVADPALDLADLARSLVRGPLGLCLSLSITQIDPGLCSRSEDTTDSQSCDYIETGWIELTGTFEDYWNERGKNLRQNLRKQRSKLAAQGVSVHMRVLTDGSEIAAAVERYGALESAGWKAGQGTAIHCDNAQGHFYRRLLESASTRGEAVVFEYLFDDRVVASNLCLQRRGILTILKTTYDESIKACSPAFLLSQEQLAYLFQGKIVSRVEYYGRMMDWHTKWTENKRTLHHFTMYRLPLLKQIAALRRRQVRRLTTD
jgi:CelD/BcsL family acetyltransferase involved in cellulose biosynthesis